MKILLRTQDDTNWNMVETATYGKEAELQHLLAESPQLIAVQEVRENAEPLLVAVREFSLPVGYIDLLAFSPVGDIAVVECKLASSPEVKRKVIGQVLEYGAYLWQMSYEELDQGIRLRTGESLAELMQKATQDSDWDEEAFRNNVESALSEGNFILIIVVDEINEELTRIVRYMNVCGNPSFDFAALEMRRFQSTGTEMLIPRFFGPTHSAKTASNRSATKRWDEPSFFAKLQKRHDNESVEVAGKLLEWGKKNALIWWGKGKQSGSFVPYLHHKDIEHQLFAVYTYGSVEIYFQWYQYKSPFDTDAKRLELLKMLNEIEGVDIPKTAITKRPSIPLRTLAECKNLEQFLKIFDWFLEEIKKE